RREAEAARSLQRTLPATLRVTDLRAVPTAFWAADLCLTHLVYLEAIRAYLDAGGRSRGSALVLDPEGVLPCPSLDESWRFSRNGPGAEVDGQVLEVWVEDGEDVKTSWVPVRPIPEADGWFEEVWRDYREGRTFG
ncbi:MAG: oxidoreductase, partial [Gemmatimonadota bacterium]